MTLRLALVISALIHSVVLAPLIMGESPRQKADAEKPIEIEYITIKEAPAPDRPSLEMLPSAQETPRVEPENRIETKPEEKTQAEQAKKESQLKKTKDYVNYYQLIREKVRARLKRNYTSRDKQGDVYMVFVLGSDGELQGLEIERSRSTREDSLIDIATRSMHEASPFPKFPKGLSIHSMSFNLMVSFKRE